MVATETVGLMTVGVLGMNEERRILWHEHPLDFLGMKKHQDSTWKHDRPSFFASESKNHHRRSSNQLLGGWGIQ